MTDITYESGKYFAAQKPDGTYGIYGRSGLREGSRPGSGSIFHLANANTAEGAKYQVDAYAGKHPFKLSEFVALETRQ